MHIYTHISIINLMCVCHSLSSAIQCPQFYLWVFKKAASRLGAVNLGQFNELILKLRVISFCIWFPFSHLKLVLSQLALACLGEI